MVDIILANFNLEASETVVSYLRIFEKAKLVIRQIFTTSMVPLLTILTTNAVGLEMFPVTTAWPKCSRLRRTDSTFERHFHN